MYKYIILCIVLLLEIHNMNSLRVTKSHCTGYDIQRLSCDKVMYMYH